jgi:tRNA(fMet)-specific endonuclease VapC
MTRVGLDTSAYSQFKRGDRAVVDLLDGASWIGVPVIVLGELEAGFRQGRRAADNRAELQQFLANPAVDVLSVTEDTAGVYADIVLDLKKAGTPVPANDIWIAAVAARHGAPVVTYDTHFRSIGRAGSTVLTPSPAATERDA